MTRKSKKPVHHAEMTEGECEIIRGLHAAVTACASCCGSHDINYNNAECDLEPIEPSDPAIQRDLHFLLIPLYFLLILQRNLRTI